MYVVKSYYTIYDFKMIEKHKDILGLNRLINLKVCIARILMRITKLN